MAWRETDSTTFDNMRRATHASREDRTMVAEERKT
jgi:hypothetical protein